VCFIQPSCETGCSSPLHQELARTAPIQLWRSLSSRVRSSSVTALTFPDAASPVLRLVKPEISAPVQRARVRWRTGHVAFRYTDSVGTREQFSIAAQWLAYTYPCRRFTCILTNARARLGVDHPRGATHQIAPGSTKKQQRCNRYAPVPTCASCNATDLHHPLVLYQWRSSKHNEI
jgi:hypothetical protein